MKEKQGPGLGQDKIIDSSEEAGRTRERNITVNYEQDLNMTPKVIIVVQQETLRERPRIFKLSKLLKASDIPFEIWKFGERQDEQFPYISVCNLISTRWRQRPAVLRYVVWMAAVFFGAWRYRRKASFFAVGFDSAFPIAMLPMRKPTLIFDNIDNISLSYRWPYGFHSVFRALEIWISQRAQIHVVPSRSRWSRTDANLRIVTNTPSRQALLEAKAIADQRGYRRGSDLTIYVNGWLPRTRGIRTLLRALDAARQKRLPVRVLVAGRPSCEDAGRLLSMECTENLGLLTNAEALATYYRSHIAFIYYDPSHAINVLAESQKWTDCWATDTPFVTNVEVKTLDPYLRHDACFALPYEDSDGLAALLETLVHDRSPLEKVRINLRKMNFKYWDDEMKQVIGEWLELNRAMP